jgi:hypothetical protein
LSLTHFCTCIRCIFQLLGDILLERLNSSVMVRYVSSKENLIVLMNLLRVRYCLGAFYHVSWKACLLHSKMHLVLSWCLNVHIVSNWICSVIASMSIIRKKKEAFRVFKV